MARGQSNEGHPTFLIWDSDSQPPPDDRIVVLWRLFGAESDTATFSIPRLVEENADALRSRFLGWLHDLGETLINGRRLVDRLILRPGFSYWWMTLLVEKSYGKSGRCFDAIRLMALEDLSLLHCPSKIVLVSNDEVLDLALRHWCIRAGFAYERRRAGENGSGPSGEATGRHRLPQPVQAMASLLRYVQRRWPFRQSRRRQYPSLVGSVTVADYLFHLTPEAVASGVFASNYWTRLVDELREHKVRVNWLHHYVEQEMLPSVPRAADLIDRFNRNSGGAQVHAVFDRALSVNVICRTLLDYARLLVKGFHLRKVQLQFGPAHSNLDFWPLFEADWQCSIFGSNAMANCLSLNLFERILGGLPRQELGLYLQEHQGWESAFVFAWVQAGHGRLVGVPHATVRFWDLRYFLDPRSICTKGAGAPPMPDLIAFNGPAAIDAARKGGVPEERIIEVEALRYLYLSQPRNNLRGRRRDPELPLRVLILGDYFSSITSRQMQWLAAAASQLPIDTRYIIRPHPMCSVDPTDYPALHCEVSDTPLDDLLCGSDIAFSGNITSAAVDAYVAGVTVVSMLDGETLNLSPLRGLDGVIFVTNIGDLVEALTVYPANPPNQQDYFFLDPKLTRWRLLLNMGQGIDRKA
jgi:surface carbohydrate biosynthesis protein (TIGR04326 family)